MHWHVGVPTFYLLTVMVYTHMHACGHTLSAGGKIGSCVGSSGVN